MWDTYYNARYTVQCKMEDPPFLLEIYWVLQWPWCCRLQVQELTQRHRPQQTGRCRRRTPRDPMYSKIRECKKKKKLHLLWKSKSTSRCEYYKAFISCSFIVFPPISEELLPSSGHSVNSCLSLFHVCSHNDTKLCNKAAGKLQTGWCRHES